MKNLFSKMWNDDQGIIALEYILLMTIVGLGLVVGFSAVSEALNSELVELANAILAIDQSYSYAGVTASTGCGSVLGGRAGVNVSDSIQKDTLTISIPTQVSIDVCP